MTILSREPIGRAAAPDPARTLDTLATALVILLTIGILYLAREILVPVAIAVLLSFVLSPPVKVLRGWGLGKTVSVGLVVFLSFSIAVGVGFLLTKQITDLAAEAPRYQATVTSKVDTVRNFLANNPVLGKLNALLADVAKVEPEKRKKDEPAPALFPPGKKTLHGLQGGSTDKAPMKVEVVSPPPGILTILQTIGGAAASPLAAAAFVALFIVFILMQREDLRDRFIRVVGFGDLHRTTLAMNEAASRLSRYFLAQVLLNFSFGIVAAAALAIIGVPSAILWGIVAALMRFIPYLGSVGAAFFPLLMASAASSGWGMVIETGALFAVIELITGQVIEPLVFGANTGISPIAVVLSATFWTWLWGPVGLVLSTPLTVCLVVLGRHVERFRFLDLILGDTPPLTAAESFYQRLLVGDPSEIVDHAEKVLKDHSLLAYCDSVAMKALLMAQADVRRGILDDDGQERLRDMMGELMEDLVELDQTRALQPDDDKPEPPAAPIGDGAIDDVDDAEEPSLPEVSIRADWARENAVVCVAGRTPLDEAAAHMLAALLARHEIGARVEPADSLTTSRLHELSEDRPHLVILSFLDADLSVAQARFAVRRLRRRVPDVPLVSAFWMQDEDQARTARLCDDVRCETCVSSLPQAITLCLERAADGPATEARGKVDDAA